MLHHRKTGLLLTLLALGALALTPPAAAQGTVTIGTADPNADTLFPFGSGGSYSGEYQQIYDGSAFPGVLTLNNVSFSSEQGNGNTPGTATYGLTVFLSNTARTTDANSPTGISPTFANNFGTNRVQVFNGTITANLQANNTFDLTIPFMTPFTFTNALPRQPNLLFDVFVNSDTPTTVPFTLFQGTSSTQTASAFFADGSGSGPVATQPGGLLTQFNTPAPVPEPSPLLVLLMGGGGVLVAGMRRRAAGRRTGSAASQAG